MKIKFNWKEYILYCIKYIVISFILLFIIFSIVYEDRKATEKKIIQKCIDTYGADNVIIQYEDTPYKHKFNCTSKYTIKGKFVNVTGGLI